MGAGMFALAAWMVHKVQEKEKRWEDLRITDEERTSIMERVIYHSLIATPILPGCRPNL